MNLENVVHPRQIYACHVTYWKQRTTAVEQVRKTNNSWSHGSEIPLQARSFGVLCDRHLVLDGGLPGLRHILGRFKISDNGAICDYSPRSISIREIYDEA